MFLDWAHPLSEIINEEYIKLENDYNEFSYDSLLQIGQSLHEDNMIYELEQSLATLTNNNDKLSVRLKLRELVGSEATKSPHMPLKSHTLKGSGKEKP